MRFKKTITAVASAALLALPGVALADGHESQVSVVHGVPGLTVDVYVNGDLTLEDFEPGTVAGPLTLPAGTYDIEVFVADADPDNATPPISAPGVEVPGGINASIVAHLAEDGSPAASVFVNDVSEVAAGEARLTVRHTAAAGAVDILAGGSPIFEGVTNPNEGTVDVPAGDYDVAVNAAGTDTEVISVAGFGLAEGANTIVYAIGDPAADPSTFGLVVQTISDLHSSPDGVPAGTAGLATDSSGAALTAAGLLLLAGVSLGLRRRATETA